MPTPSLDTISRFGDATLSLVFQTRCVYCQRRSDHFLCPDCAVVVPVGEAVCDCCGDQLSSAFPQCGRCRRKTLACERIRSLFFLSPAMREVVRKIKFQNQLMMLRYFKKTLIQFPWEIFPADAVLVPVPLHWAKWCQRGFNQSELLGQWIALLTRRRFLSEGLQKIKATEAQSLLSRTRRETNLRTAFRWDKRYQVPPKILLIDDIFTTGSTLEAAGRVLKKAGAQEIFGWTLFRTPLRIL